MRTILFHLYQLMIEKTNWVSSMGPNKLLMISNKQLAVMTG